MGNRLEKAEEISAQLKDKYQQIRELQDKLSELNMEATSLQKEIIKNTILGNIENGNLHTPSEERKVPDDERMEEEDYEDLVKKHNMHINTLQYLEELYYQYEEEYVLPMGEFGFIPEDDWDGYDTVKSRMVINVNGSYIVDGQYKFDTLEELKQWAQTKYPEFMKDKKNDIKLKTLKSVSVQQLEDMFDGKEISKEKISKRERFEQALLRDDVIDYFLEKSPEEIEALFGTEVATMVGFDQNNPHHCYDLFEHTLNTVDGIDTNGLSPEDTIKLKVAAFLHDVGKPQVAMNKGNKTVLLICVLIIAL